ncbi:MAG: hypothetical protein ACE5EO_05255 [Candidatus Krumholzibacteriia bacterium]
MRKLTPRKTLTLVALTLGALVFNSCIFNAEEGTPPDKVPPPAFKSLKAREDVLHNLELAWNQQNINQYDKLLDDNFTFFFGAKDISLGKVTSTDWGRASELIATGHMFDRTFDPPPGPSGTDPGPIISIDISMDFPVGEEKWDPLSDPVVHPTETWYEKTVDYTFTITAGGDFRFLTGKVLRASIVIRFAEASGDSIYRIVQWRDDV